MKSAQNLSPGRFRHPEAESEVKNLQNFHPDLEISISYYSYLFPIISYYSFFWEPLLTGGGGYTTPEFLNKKHLNFGQGLEFLKFGQGNRGLNLQNRRKSTENIRKQLGIQQKTIG